MPSNRFFKCFQLKVALSAGFTILEVMFVLAISGIIFAAAISLFGSQTSETQFSQTLQDLNSEITAKLKEVNTNLSGVYQQFSCSVTKVSGRMQAVLSASGPQSNNDCIYLGRAFFAPQDSSTLYTYAVLGNRQAYQNDTASGTANFFDDTNPVPAIGAINLTETYNLRSAKITSSQIKNASGAVLGNYYLVGYYTDLQGGSNSSLDNNPHLLSKGYNIGQPSPQSYDNSVYDCIIKTNACAAAPQDVSVWTLCLADTGGNRSARLDVNNSSAGITTNLQFNVQCP